MTRIGVILGSTRPGRNGEQVAAWVMDIARRRDDADFELIDLADYPLPHLDEPLPPSMGQYRNLHTQQWADTIDRYDGFIMVTPEYNHSTSGVLKNAIDYLFAEWNNKAVGFVSYGSVGAGGRAPAPGLGRAEDGRCAHPGCAVDVQRLRALRTVGAERAPGRRVEHLDR